MSDHDARPRSFVPDHAVQDVDQWLADWRQALVFLTQLPIGQDGALPAPVLAGAMRAFPLAGAVIGIAVGAVLVAAMILGLPAPLAAVLAIGANIALTGALHEDGLADIADGFGGGGDRERKLEIMRDSRIGTYGVLALIIAVAIRITVLALLADRSMWLAVGVVIAAAAVSRVAPAGILHVLAPARHDGASAAAGRPGRGTVVQAAALATLISVLVLLPASLLTGLIVVPLAGGLGCLGVLWLARAQIGGQTGDVAGASQQVSEAAILLGVIAVLGT